MHVLAWTAETDTWVSSFRIRTSSPRCCLALPTPRPIVSEVPVKSEAASVALPQEGAVVEQGDGGDAAGEGEGQQEPYDTDEVRVHGGHPCPSPLTTS